MMIMVVVMMMMMMIEYNTNRVMEKQLGRLS